MSNTNQNDVKATVQFAAIDPYIEKHIVKPTETLVRAKDMMQWGDNNAYPEYVLELYNSVPTLRAIVNGNVDFISGDNVISKVTLNARESARDIVRSLALDKGIYGGFALQVIRAKDGSIAETHYIDLRFLRANKDCNVFYYSEDWGKFRTTNVIKYPAFIKDLKWNEMTQEQRDANASSIL